MRLTQKGMARMRDDLARDARVDYRRPGSDWVRLQLAHPADVTLALRLLRVAIRANPRGSDAMITHLRAGGHA